jgi:hypothetical protein
VSRKSRHWLLFQLINTLLKFTDRFCLCVQHISVASKLFVVIIELIGVASELLVYIFHIVDDYDIVLIN